MWTSTALAGIDAGSHKERPMTRCTRTLILAAASVGLVATAGAASSGAPASAAPGVDARIVTLARESADIASWAKTQGLVGLSPASLHPAPATAAAPRYARDIFAAIP
jgi:hypothetical protein